jgi:2-haloacid dehalogenase
LELCVVETLDQVHTLTFDAFGTILDLGGSHARRLDEFVARSGAKITADALWERWRQRQRVEQFQDNLFQAGHFGYLDSCRRALLYTLRASKAKFSDHDVREIMQGCEELQPFPDVVPGLERLREKFKLVVLSNGENEYVSRVVRERIRFEFDDAISVDDVGAFKPSPQVYRYAARRLKAEPQQLMMVSAHSFDAVGARASGYRAAYVNRYELPYDETPYQPDFVANDFLDLATQLGCA